MYDHLELIFQLPFIIEIYSIVLNTSTNVVYCKLVSSQHNTLPKVLTIACAKENYFDSFY